MELGWLRDALPRGQTLPEQTWHARHVAILILLWLHAAAVPLYGFARGYRFDHVLLESVALPVIAAVATWGGVTRRARAAVASVGLLTASAILVHLSGGMIEMHFHFFVMVTVVALYQDWLPFLMAVGFVFVHHGVMGAVDPDSVFSHMAGRNDPWLWAAIHAGFICAISAVCLVTWRLNETTLDQRRRAEERLVEESLVVQTLHDIGMALAGELETGTLVQKVTDAATSVTGARFGAFFYNVVDGAGESYMLYALSGASHEAFEKFGLPRNTEIFAATFRGESTVRIDDVTTDPRYGKSAPHFGMPPGHLPVRSYLAVPVRTRDGNVLGGLFLGHPEPARFDEVDERLATGIAAQTGVVFDKARLFELEQQAAVTLQRSLLPPTMPEVEGLTLLARYLPTSNTAEVGGDWYDAFTLADGRLVLSVGDVAGHDLRAAAVMGQLRTVARSCALDGQGPGAVLARMDSYMQASEIHELTTVVQAVYDPVSQMLTIARAGHMAPLVVTADGQTKYLDVPAAPPLGFGLIDAAQPPEEMDVGLLSGTTVVFFTDGLVERRGESLDGGLERLARATCAIRALDADLLCDELVARVAGPSTVDDVALLVLSVDVDVAIDLSEGISQSAGTAAACT